MIAQDLPEAAWRKSTFSGANSNCVEVAATRDRVATRDSKSPTGPTLTVTPTTWHTFIRHVTTA